MNVPLLVEFFNKDKYLFDKLIEKIKETCSNYTTSSG